MKSYSYDILVAETQLGQTFDGVGLLLARVKRVPLMTGFRRRSHISLKSLTVCPTARPDRRDRSTWKLSHRQRLINPVTHCTFKDCGSLAVLKKNYVPYLRINNTRCFQR